MAVKRKSELLVTAVLAAVILFIGVRDSGLRKFWLDELISWQLATDHSWFHMIRALAAGSDGMMPFYHTVMWTWAQLPRCLGAPQYAAKEMFFRFPSVLFFAGAVVLMQRSLRPAFSLSLATLAVLIAFLLPSNAIKQISEARAYSLIMLLCSTSILIAVRYEQSQDSRSRKRMLCMNAVTQAAAVLTHPFAGLYSAATLAGAAIHHWKEGSLSTNKWFRSYVLSYLVGWLALIPWLPGLRMQMSINQPQTWVPVPAFKQLYQMFTPGQWAWPFTLLLIIILVINAMASGKVAEPEEPMPEASSAQARLLIWIGGSYVALTIAVWIASHFIQPLFVDRYFSANATAWAIFIAAGLETVTRRTPAAARNALAGLACLGVPMFSYLLIGRSVWSGSADNTFLTRDIPVVCQTGNRYMPRRFYYGSKHPAYYLVLDWDSALNKTADRGAALVDYQILTRLNKYYPDDHVMQATDFLAQFKKFYLFQEKTNPFSADLPASQYDWQPVPENVSPAVGEMLDPVYLITRKDQGAKKASAPQPR